MEFGLTFPTIEAALTHCMNECEDEDNVGYPFWSWMDDSIGMAEYDAEVKSMCCGIYEQVVGINGRKAIIVINYGH